MKFVALGCATLASVSLMAAQAKADLYKVEFTLEPGQWTVLTPGTLYGAGEDPTISGSVILDSTKSDGSAFKAIDYTTGTRVWKLSDIDVGGTQVFFSGGFFANFGLTFKEGGGYNFFYSDNTVDILDPSDSSRLLCNGCVNVTNVTNLTTAPEPASWGLMLVGFGGLGAVARVRRGRPVVA